MPALPRFPHAVSFRILLALVVAAGMVISESEKAFAVHAVFPGLIVDIDADTNGGAFTLLDDIDFTDEPGVDLAGHQHVRLDRARRVRVQSRGGR